MFENTLIGALKAEIANALLAAYHRACVDKELPEAPAPDFTVEVPREAAFGDFSANLAMLLARSARKNPRDIANLLTERIDCIDGIIASCEVAGAGFINFRLKEGWQAKLLKEILEQGENFGKNSFYAGEKIQVEFVSANPTGEMHMGNARGAAIGDALYNLFDLCGAEAEKEFYINDAGNQIEKFGFSLEARYLQLLGEDVEFPEDGYHGEDITDTMRELVAEVGDKYQKIESSLRRAFLIEYGLEKKIAAMRATLERFGVKYHVWFSEQTLHESGAIADVLNILREKDYLYEKEGATWLACTKFGEEKDEVVIRANGIPTYYAADIAYHDNKFKRGFGKTIDIWGADHHGHVARMKGALEALGYDREGLEVILMQLVRLVSNGEVVRMSKRTGRYITLNDLLDDIGVDAARFFFTMRSSDSQMDFDLDLAVQQSSDNPVYYVQYAHARICSILSAFLAEGNELPAFDKVDFSLLKEAAELQLIRKMADFPDEIILAAKNREPHRIPIFVQDLASLFHNFYTHCRVLTDDKELTNARLYLIKAAAQVIKKGLSIIGVSAPEKM